MKNLLVYSLFILFSCGLSAQELNCTVTVNAEQTGKTQLSVFKTLETSVKEFMNQSWTELDLEDDERIQCNIFITIKDYNSDSFKATLQVQSSRPIYGSTYTTPVLNFKDNDFNFNYTEYQPLRYSKNTYNSNLVSNLSFYAFTILGLDADTYALEGGEDYLQEAKQIVNISAQQGGGGWKANDGNQSKYKLNADLLSSNFSKFREAMYMYHRQGLDVMHQDLEAGKESIVNSIQLLRDVNNSRPNSAPMRAFFDAKSSEIQSVFSGGPSVSLTEVVENLKRIAPLYNKNWNKIKF
ncbi:DUF4835 family protein [Mesonia sp. MT50]|uniref:DUF4835 family protein n=1 Tax=Mesonia profundi TaxID=3070998 RepID=A0ABU0ZYD6_9FLAO|nr:DUF4835 family protein [Mesonia profundi]MDQ7916422.1 DUF4835 family protein [Mesonia profundi]